MGEYPRYREFTNTHSFMQDEGGGLSSGINAVGNRLNRGGYCTHCSAEEKSDCGDLHDEGLGIGRKYGME